MSDKEESEIKGFPFFARMTLSFMLIILAPSLLVLVVGAIISPTFSFSDIPFAFLLYIGLIFSCVATGLYYLTPVSLRSPQNTKK